MSRRPLRLLHTSDVHLGSRDSARNGGATREELALARIVELAAVECVDLLLIAGDLFDSNRIDVEVLAYTRTQLERAGCPVVVIPGNHDCYDEESVYRQEPEDLLGPDVLLLAHEDGETLDLPHLDLTLWGKGLVVHEPAYRPVDGIPPRPEDGWFVGLAHGFVVPDRREPRSSLITPAEIATSGLDYLALGHVHVYRDVSSGPTRALYPGAPTNPWASAPGRVALVDLDPARGVEVTARDLEI